MRSRDNHFRSHQPVRYFVIAVILSLSAASALAQTSVFTYQGRLTDGGTPANGTFDMQFKLYDLLTSGTLQGTPNTITNTTVQATSERIRRKQFILWIQRRSRQHDGRQQFVLRTERRRRQHLGSSQLILRRQCGSTTGLSSTLNTTVRLSLRNTRVICGAILTWLASTSGLAR